MKSALLSVSLLVPALFAQAQSESRYSAKL